MVEYNRYFPTLSILILLGSLWRIRSRRESSNSSRHFAPVMNLQSKWLESPIVSSGMAASLKGPREIRWRGLAFSCHRW